MIGIILEAGRGKRISKAIFEKPKWSIEIKKKSEETLGELFSYFILETILIGKLTNINPFNQPAVEQVKVVTKKYLLK